MNVTKILLNISSNNKVKIYKQKDKFGKMKNVLNTRSISVTDLSKKLKNKKGFIKMISQFKILTLKTKVLTSRDTKLPFNLHGIFFDYLIRLTISICIGREFQDLRCETLLFSSDNKKHSYAFDKSKYQLIRKKENRDNRDNYHLINENHDIYLQLHYDQLNSHEIDFCYSKTLHENHDIYFQTHYDQLNYDQMHYDQMNSYEIDFDYSKTLDKNNCQIINEDYFSYHKLHYDQLHSYHHKHQITDEDYCYHKLHYDQFHLCESKHQITDEDYIFDCQICQLNNYQETSKNDDCKAYFCNIYCHCSIDFCQINYRKIDGEKINSLENDEIKNHIVNKEKNNTCNEITEKQNDKIIDIIKTSYQKIKNYTIKNIQSINTTHVLNVSLCHYLIFGNYDYCRYLNFITNNLSLIHI
jgi:hypothetical protein